jgi:uncharacterized protein (DUF1330 family)
MAAHVVVLAAPRPDRSEDLARYSQATESVRESLGGKVVFRGPVLKTVAGTSLTGIGIVLEFPDAEVAASFFAHDTYRSLVPLRDKIFTSLEIHIIG